MPIGNAAGLSNSTLRLGLFTAYALVERHPKFLALIHQAFVGLEVALYSAIGYLLKLP